MRNIDILLIDDDDVDRIVITRMVDSTGLPINLEQVSTIDNAMALLEARRFDCLLADYQLGGENAFELIEQISRCIEDPPNIVLLTGMSSEQLAVKALQHGVCDYISKDGLDADKLKATIENALEKVIERRDRDNEHKTLEILSLYDPLTELPNRSLFLDRLDNLIETSKRNLGKFAVLMIDLDGFKQINDKYGHHVGDEVLREVGKRLHHTARDSDTCARMGGDEFTALLPGTNSLENVITITAKLARVISEPIEFEGQSLQHGVSIGVSMYPRHGVDANTLLQRADKAMYEAKKSGIDFSVFDPVNLEHGNREQCIADSLPNLSADSGLQLYYQPKVSLLDGNFHGAEVLVRWQHPELGLLPPVEFIATAERLSLIRDLTYNVVEMAACQISQWQLRGFKQPLSINLSPTIVDDHDLPERLRQVLGQYDVSSESIILEITESSLISDPRRARKQLEALVEEGFRISIDDFGTGYSSLKYLRDFPFQEIKIDQTFVKCVGSEWRDDSIISAILKLAEGFKADCVAEGIESIEVWDRLKKLGCHYGQGFLISKALPAEEFITWKDHWQQQADLGYGNTLSSKKLNIG